MAGPGRLLRIPVALALLQFEEHPGHPWHRQGWRGRMGVMRLKRVGAVHTCVCVRGAVDAYGVSHQIATLTPRTLMPIILSAGVRLQFSDAVQWVSGSHLHHHRIVLSA